MPRFTMDQLQKLEAKYAAGVQSISYKNGSQTLMSRADMKKVIDEMRRDLGVESGSTTRVGRFSRGG